MYVRLSRRGLVILAAAVAAAGIGLLVYWLVDTDVKRVKRTLDALARAVETNDVEAVTPFFDPSFRMAGMDTEEFRVWYGGVLLFVKVKQVSIYDREVTIDREDRDLAVATVQTFVAADRRPGEPRIDWRLELRRRGDEWKVSSVRAFWPPPVNSEIPLRGITADAPYPY